MHDHALSARPGSYVVEATASSQPFEAATAMTPYEVGVCRDEQAFRGLGAEWNSLLGRALQPSAFLKHQWMETWWDQFGSVSGAREPFVLTARDEQGQLVGLLPLYRETRGPGPLRHRILRFLGTAPEAPEHLDAIVHQTHHQQILDALLAGLARLRDQFDALELTDLAEGSVLLPALTRLARNDGFAHRSWPWEQCPYVRTEGSFEGYLKKLSSKHRYKVRLFGRRLAEGRQVEVEVAREPEQVRRGMEEFFRLHSMRWALKDGISGFDDAAVHTFHRGVAAALAADDAVRLFLLRCDGRAVAACYCLYFDRRMFFYQPGFDPEFRKLHVGKVLLGKALEYCFKEGIREFDFLRGMEEYKFDWTSDVRPTWACDVAVSRRGRVWYALRSLRRRIQAPLIELRRRLVAKLRGSESGSRLLMMAKRLLDPPRSTPAIDE
ncbi:MAG: GNAT family N-acetyltransferase [Betaproteobacteria bacterium]|nr:GNAT family N-acetyltransferase [Betaproteobacteria bacterium]